MDREEILRAMDWCDQWLNWAWLSFAEADHRSLWDDQRHLRQARDQLAQEWDIDNPNFVTTPKE